MHKSLLAVSLLAASTLGHGQTPDLRTAAGCGPATAAFSVKTNKSAHPLAKPEPGKALVYVVEDVKNPRAMSFGQVTTRVGLDGTWVGANHGQSYVTFQAEPGPHRVCTDWQSSLKRLQDLSGAADLTLEAGKVYYYRSEVTIPWTWTGKDNELGDDQKGDIKLVALDDSEGVLLISKSAVSDWKVKH